MRQLAVRNQTNGPLTVRKPRTAEPLSLLSRQISPHPLSGSALQAKSACACGGGCPRCQSTLPIQTKLAVSEPGDMYEQEADRIAEQVMRMPAPTLQRSCASCTEGGSTCPKCAAEKSGLVQRKAERDSDRSGSVADGFLHDLGLGQPLDSATRTGMESRFGSDFSQVRVHTDAKAAKSARAVNALAYTVGRDVVFGAGQYEPNRAEGARLLAHELAHVVQQGRLGTRSGPIVQRYSHQDCEESDLRAHIWPADRIARQMVEKAIRVLSASPVDPAVTPLLSKYFMSNAPSISTILAVFRKIKKDFDGNDYQYECEDDCEDENAYVYGIWTDIHLCMNMLRGKANDCIASTIVHEFSHYSANTDDESGRCYDCASFPGCPVSLSASDATDNADSYAAFAYELYPMSV